jgi:hypothetical protein
MKRSALVLQLVGGVAFLGACSGSSNSGFGVTVYGADSGTVVKNPDGSTMIIPPGGGQDSSTMMLGGGDSGITPPPGGDATTSGACTYLATDTVDHDGDGWSGADGDCNDCNKYINPGAYDIAGNMIDEDCSGTADDEVTNCDSTLSGVATSAGSDGAKAMDLCRTTTDAAPKPMKTWGVISADYVLPSGESASGSAFGLGFGILGPTFGTGSGSNANKAQQGSHFLGLSSGSARQPTDQGYQDVSGFDKGYTSGAPTGFPGTTAACPGVQFGPAHDGAALRVVVRVPTNALTMSFDSNFFSFEFPDYVCSEYNDTYVVIMTPAPAGEPSSANNNIAFDSTGNIISVNAGFLQVCDAQNAGGKNFTCSEGSGKLQGTGFGVDTALDGQNHASSDWLTTTVSVAAQAGTDITLLFAIWDSSDGVLDSSVLIDNVQWTFATAPNQVPPVATPPSTQPK